MKKMLQIALLKIQLTFKDKTALLWMFAAPLIFVTLLVLGYSGRGNVEGVSKYPVSIVNYDKDIYANELVDLLKKDKAFTITEENYDIAKKHIEDGKAALGLVIPEGFTKAFSKSENKSIEVLKLQENENTIALTALIENYLYQLRISVNTGELASSTLVSLGKVQDINKAEVKDNVEANVLKNLSAPKIKYSSSKVTIDKKTGIDELSYTAIGIFVMFMMFFITRAAGSIHEEKEIGTWKRVISTPTKDYSILGGYILGTLVLGWIQVGVIILASKYIFHVNWGNSPLGIVILFTSFLLALIGLGSALSSFVKSKAQLGALAPIITMPTCIIGGCYFPREIMSDTMLKISNFVPQTWVIKGVTDLVARGSDISGVFIPSAVLLIFASVFFIIGLTFLSFQDK